MRILLTVIFWILATVQILAQGGVHDYTWMYYHGGARELIVVSTNDEKRIIDLKLLSGKDWDMDKKQMLDEVVKWETSGWELVDFEFANGYSWLLRKPKQQDD